MGSRYKNPFVLIKPLVLTTNEGGTPTAFFKIGTICYLEGKYMRIRNCFYLMEKESDFDSFVELLKDDDGAGNYFDDSQQRINWNGIKEYMNKTYTAPKRGKR